MTDKNKLEVKQGQTLVIEREQVKQYGKTGRREKIYQKWKVKEIYEHMVLCERKVKLGTLRESFTFQDLKEHLVIAE